MSSNPQFYDRVLESSTTEGTGSYELDGPITGFQSFSVVGDGNDRYYCAAEVNEFGAPSGDWEVGLGTYTASGALLARTAILTSSNANSAVDWGAGIRRIFLTQPAQSLTAGSHTVTTTGNIDDLDFGNASVIRMNNASAAKIRGLKAGLDGQEITIVSVGAGQVDLSHQDAGDGTAANRLINFVTTGITPLAAGVGTAAYQYDATTARWRLVTHVQGARISVPYNAADFTSTAGTWTVQAGDDALYTYYLVGRQLTISLLLASTSTSNCGGQLLISLPNAWSVTGAFDSTAIAPATLVGGITPTEPILVHMNSGIANNKLCISRLSFAAWPDTTNTLTIAALITITLD